MTETISRQTQEMNTQPQMFLQPNKSYSFQWDLSVHVYIDLQPCILMQCKAYPAVNRYRIKLHAPFCVLAKS